VKAALGELGFDLGGVRLPLVELDETEMAELRRMLDALRPAMAAARD
jgi:dihydrodipicolinate synthase/N-acetylneuraminate lyase